MDGTVGARGSTEPSDDAAVWRGRLADIRATMDGLRHQGARIAGSIAETERAVASTLRRLADDDRARGRSASADRRAARAQEAELFAVQESVASRPDDRRGAVGSSRVHPGP